VDAGGFEPLRSAHLQSVIADVWVDAETH
jgi:hypothetical protein